MSKKVIAHIKSKNDIPIELSEKQWLHIVESHDYMAGNMDKILETIHEPDYIVTGTKQELIAMKHYNATNISEKYCVVVYKEINDNGFIITSFFTSKEEKILKKGISWKKQ